MKKIFVLSFVLLFFLSMAVTPGYSMSTKTVLKKMIKAQGGKKNLQKIKDSKLTGTFFFTPMNLKGPVSTYWKNPNKIRTDIELMATKIIQAYDGKTAWMDNPMQGGLAEMPENLARGMKRQAMGSDSLLNPKKYGITFAFKGKEKIGEKEYLLLEQTFADGHKTMYYVDSKTYLTYKIKTTSFNQMGKEVPSEIFSTDYKKVGKLMVAHTMIIFQEGREFVKMTFDKVSHNTGLDDSLFTMPKKKE